MIGSSVFIRLDEVPVTQSVIMTRTSSLTLPLTLYRYNRRSDEADVSAATMATAFGHNDIKEAEH